MFFISILLIQVQEVQKQAKIMILPQTPPWILKFFVILMSTCYNKSNLKVKESSDQYLIEMSILNGVSVQFCFFLWKYKNGLQPLQNKILVDFEKWGKD